MFALGLFMQKGYEVASKLDTPLEYFSSGNIAHSLGEAAKDCRPPYTSFLVWGGLFRPPIEN